MVDQRTMAELLRAPTEGYADAIVVLPILAEHFELKHGLINMMTLDQFYRLEKDNPHDHIRTARRWLKKEPPRSILTWEDLDRYKDLLRACPHHGFTELHQLDTFYNALNPVDQDSLNSAAGGNLLERRTQDVLTIIENNSKVLNSQNKSIVSQVKSSDANSFSSSEIAKLTHALNYETSHVTTAMTAILKQFQATPPLAFVKVIEEICVTCGAAVNYNQGNFGYRPSGVANQIRPPGFAQPNVQNNQNWFSQPQQYNRGNNFNEDSSYQTSIHQNQVAPLSELEKIKKMNEINIKSMQTQINNVKNKLRNEMKTSIQASMSNQTNELKNMMASLFQMNTASTLSSGPLPSNTIANPKGELKAITTRSGIVLDGPIVPMPPPFINPKEDECVEETLTDPKLSEDPLHPNIPYPSRMHKQKQQEKVKVQIHKFWQMFKQLHINITLANALILILKYQKMLKALFSNEKLLELENTPLNENCSTVILKKLLEKLGDPGKFLISCSFSELKCKALADLGASINLMPLSVWKKLGLPELISTRMTLELANRAICTPTGIARDVFVPVGKPFLRTARTLIDVHREEMIFRNGDERLTLNIRHDTSSYSNQPQKESINIINIYADSCEDYLEDLFATNHLSGNPIFSSHSDLTLPEVKDDIFDPEGDIVLIEKFLNLDSTKDLPHPHNINPLSGSTTSYSPDHLLEEEYLLNHDPTKEMDSILEDSVDECNLADPNDNIFDTIPEMFTDEHALDYSTPPIYDDFDDDLFEFESDNDDAYNDLFDSKGEKIKKSKHFIDELDLPRYSDFLPSPDNVQATPYKNVEKIAISRASLILEDFNPSLYEPPFHKKVSGSETLISFSSKNEEKVFKPMILTSKGVHTSLLSELSHQGLKAFEVIKILKSPMEIFPWSYGEDICILDVPCLHFYPP
nr:hypothetical protein [Tanacetum cinerariifolium]